MEAFLLLTGDELTAVYALSRTGLITLRDWRSCAMTLAASASDFGGGACAFTGDLGAFGTAAFLSGDFGGTTSLAGDLADCGLDYSHSSMIWRTASTHWQICPMISDLLLKVSGAHQSPFIMPLTSMVCHFSTSCTPKLIILSFRYPSAGFNTSGSYHYKTFFYFCAS